jgi:hypothetical protein
MVKVGSKEESVETFPGKLIMIIPLVSGKDADSLLLSIKVPGWEISPRKASRILFSKKRQTQEGISVLTSQKNFNGC